MATPPLRDPAEIPRLSWAAAPASSHLWGWLFVDARLYGLAKSLLKVKFRDKAGRVTGCYGYWVGDQEGQSIDDAMRAAARPGEVLHARLIARGNRGFPVDG